MPRGGAPLEWKARHRYRQSPNGKQSRQAQSGRYRERRKKRSARLVQEIDKIRFRKMVTSPRALARSSDSEQEKAAFRRRNQPLVMRVSNHVVILLWKMTISWAYKGDLALWRVHASPPGSGFGF
jgi:hypothetical protein